MVHCWIVWLHANMFNQNMNALEFTHIIWKHLTEGNDMRRNFQTLANPLNLSDFFLVAISQYLFNVFPGKFMNLKATHREISLKRAMMEKNYL